MTPRILAALTVIAAPIVAFGGGWGDQPVGVWTSGELAWAQPLEADGLSTIQIEALNEPPPRPTWCDPNGIVYTPTAAECQQYDLDLDNWLLDFMDTDDLNVVAQVQDPPTYCGGC